MINGMSSDSSTVLRGCESSVVAVSCRRTIALVLLACVSTVLAAQPSGELVIGEVRSTDLLILDTFGAADDPEPAPDGAVDAADFGAGPVRPAGPAGPGFGLGDSPLAGVKLVRVDPRSLNNPFNTQDPVNNSFVGGQVVPIAPDQLSGGEPPVMDPVEPPVVDPVDPPVVDPDPPVVDPEPPVVDPMDPPLEMIAGSFHEIPTGVNIAFDLIGLDLFSFMGFVGEGEFSLFQSSRGGDIGLTILPGLLPTGAAGITESSPIFADLVDPIEATLADGLDVTVSSQLTQFPVRLQRQNFVLTFRAARRGGRQGVVAEVMPGDLGVIRPLVACDAATLDADVIRTPPQIRIGFNIETLTCQYNVLDLSNRFLEIRQGDPRDGPDACASYSVFNVSRSDFELTVDGVTEPRPGSRIEIPGGTTSTIVMRHVDTLANVETGSSREFEFVITFEDRTDECNGDGTGSFQGALAGEITIQSVRELP